MNKWFWLVTAQYVVIKMEMLEHMRFEKGCGNRIYKTIFDIIGPFVWKQVKVEFLKSILTTFIFRAKDQCLIISEGSFK